MKPYLLLLITFTGFLSYSYTHSYLSDSAASSGNTFTASAEFPPTTNHPVISEIQINGATALQDFIELYNPTSSSIPIAGWKLRKRISSGSEDSVAVIGTGKSIPAHGFFLWANSESGFSTSIGADEATTQNISENNRAALLMPDDTLVDQVAWGNGTDQFVEGTPIDNGSDQNKSMERKAYSSSTITSMTTGGTHETKGNGFDSDNNSTDFILRPTSQPQNSLSPTETP